MTRTLCVASFIVLLGACGQITTGPQGGQYDLGDKVLASVDNPAAPLAAGAKIPAAPAKRIIYNATLDLSVEDFARAEKQIAKLVHEVGGYVAEFAENRVQGAPTSGKWVARVPVDQFNSFLDQLDELGVARNKKIDSREVTEEYVDLKSRLASKQQVEERVAQLLQKQAGEIREVIAIETELGRVREEVERIAGRLRYLEDRTEMTTITITVWETKDYTPAPTTLAGRVGTAFHESLAALATLGESVLIAVVAFSPWAAAAVVFGTPLGIVILRSRRKRA